MRYKPLLVLLSGIFCVQVVAKIELAAPTETFSESDVSSICKIIEENILDMNQTEDILLTQTDHQFRNSVLGDIVKCINGRSAVVQSSLKQTLANDKLRKASMIVIEAKSTATGPLMKIIKQQVSSTVFNHMAKILLIIHDGSSMASNVQVLKTFKGVGFSKVALVTKAKDRLLVNHIQLFLNGYSNTSSINETQRFYPDILSNMQQGHFRVSIYHQPQRIIIDSQGVHNHLVYLISMIKKQMNASVRVAIVEDKFQLSQHWSQKKMDLTLNSAAYQTLNRINAAKLQTYEENGYCAVVPAPERKNIFEIIFIKPFDSMTWICLLITIASCLVIWKLYQNRGTNDSQWLLLFAIVAMFLGQNIELRRTKRIILIALLQLTIVMFFVLSNGYNGVITSSMIQSLYGERMKTFNDLLESNKTILAGNEFVTMIAKSEEFQAAKSEIIEVNQDLDSETLKRYTEAKHVMVLKCETADFIIKEINKKLVDSYYILPERILRFYEDLEASFYNMYIEKFQYYMDLLFEAGLPQAWQIFSNEYSLSNIQESLDAEYLKLEDLSQVFYVLLIGYALSFIVFLLEIFFHDFIQHIDFASCIRKIKPKRMSRVVAERPNVRRIIVQPRSVSDEESDENV